MSKSKSHGDIKNLSRDPGAAHDITGRKKAEQATQAASQYSLNLNKMPCPMLITNRDGSIEDINSCLLDLAGHDKAFCKRPVVPP